MNSLKVLELAEIINALNFIEMNPDVSNEQGMQQLNNMRRFGECPHISGGTHGTCSKCIFSKIRSTTRISNRTSVLALTMNDKFENAYAHNCLSAFPSTSFQVRLIDGKSFIDMNLKKFKEAFKFALEHRKEDNGCD